MTAQEAKKLTEDSIWYNILDKIEKQALNGCNSAYFDLKLKDEVINHLKKLGYQVIYPTHGGGTNVTW